MFVITFAIAHSSFRQSIPGLELHGNFYNNNLCAYCAKCTNMSICSRVSVTFPQYSIQVYLLATS